MSAKAPTYALYVVSLAFAALFIALFIYIGIDILIKGFGKPMEWLVTQPFVVLGRDFWFGVGGLLWLLGTVMFFAELFGRTVKKWRIVKQYITWDAVDVATVALVAAIYGGGLAATGGIPIIPGFTWVRPANALAPLFGILFGVPGALGCAIGNLLADALAGYFGIGSIGGFVGNFILAYAPYKLMKDQTLRTPRSVVEFYLFGCFIPSIWCSVYISWWLDAFEFVIGLPRALVWGFFAPFVVFNNAFITAIVSPILVFILYPIVKGWGLHWTDRIRFE